MRSFFYLLAMSAFSGFGLNADEVAQAPNQMQNQMMTPGPSCESLSDDQQMFAAKLNPQNKQMFCNQFSSSQRMSAMQLAGSTGANGRKMTPDQAVEQTARSSNMRSGGGACPVR